jgi:hypothetical protein
MRQRASAWNVTRFRLSVLQHGRDGMSYSAQVYLPDSCEPGGCCGGEGPAAPGLGGMSGVRPAPRQLVHGGSRLPAVIDDNEPLQAGISNETERSGQQRPVVVIAGEVGQARRFSCWVGSRWLRSEAASPTLRGAEVWDRRPNGGSGLLVSRASRRPGDDPSRDQSCRRFSPPVLRLTRPVDNTATSRVADQRLGHVLTASIDRGLGRWG